MAFAYKQSVNDEVMEFLIGIDYLLLTFKKDYPDLTKEKLIALLDSFSIHAAVITDIKKLLDK